jgi:HD-like signal output (HDOD) protein
MGTERIVRSARDIAALVDGMPSLPITFQRINEVVANPAGTTAQLAETVSGDQGLATRILRLANSSFYGLSARVDTITQAIGIIGTRQLRDLALAAAVMDLFKGMAPDLINADDFWTHSLAVGAGARLIAQRRGETACERHFVAGMLHDLGLMVMAQRLPKRLSENLARARTDGQPLAQVERLEMGFDHAELGAVLVERWHLPDTLVEPTACHHRLLTTARYVHDCAAVHVAEVLAEALGYGSAGEAVVPPLDPIAWNLLELSPADLSPLTTALERQVAELKAIFIA